MKIKSDDRITKLREKLQFITDNYIGKKIKEQIIEIEKIGAEYEHSIMLIKESIYSEYYQNCYMFAFEFDFRSVFPNSCFLNFLLDRNVLSEVEESKAEINDYVIYFCEGQPKHASVKQSNGIISRWGDGHIWNHQLYEVPIKYGNEVRFYKKIDISVLKENYVKFLQCIWGK